MASSGEETSSNFVGEAISNIAGDIPVESGWFKFSIIALVFLFFALVGTIAGAIVVHQREPTITTCEDCTEGCGDECNGSSSVLYPGNNIAVRDQEPTDPGQCLRFSCISNTIGFPDGKFYFMSQVNKLVTTTIGPDTFHFGNALSLRSFVDLSGFVNGIGLYQWNNPGVVATDIEWIYDFPTRSIRLASDPTMRIYMEAAASLGVPEDPSGQYWPLTIANSPPSATSVPLNTIFINGFALCGGELFGSSFQVFLRTRSTTVTPGGGSGNIVCAVAPGSQIPQLSLPPGNVADGTLINTMFFKCLPTNF